MSEQWVFDMPHSVRLTEARKDFLHKWLPDLIRSEGFNTALDGGCGVGYFSRYLTELGLHVVGVDARPENIFEAQKRHPEVKFLVHNIEDPVVCQLGVFDLVLCFGLLYHLENPFLAIRNLNTLTGKILVVESMVIPDPLPTASLFEEEQSHDQSLRYVAFVPSESCLIKMLYRAGFSYVYIAKSLPLHEDFQETRVFQRKRTLLVATKIPLELEPPLLSLTREPQIKIDPWLRPWGLRVERLRKFLRKPVAEKLVSLRTRFKQFWNRALPW